MRSIPRIKRGFTLAEMTVVAVILAILAAVAMPLTKIAVQREKEITLRRELRTIRLAIDAYKKMADEKKIEIEDDTDGFPKTLEILVKGVKSKDDKAGAAGKKDEKKGERTVKFLRRIPRDPMTADGEWGLLSSQDPPDSNTWDRKNVYDVYSKSRATAIDGTKYRDW
jgi:general secretion pathway protein G